MIVIITIAVALFLGVVIGVYGTLYWIAKRVGL